MSINRNRPKKTVQKARKNKRNVLVRYFPLFSLCVVLLAAYLIVLSVHPVGVIEYLKSEYTSIGKGNGYNIDIHDGKPKYTISDDDKYVVVSSNYVNCYNRNGKTIFEQSHSLAEPVFKLSDTRYLLYGQGERALKVNTFSDELYSLNFESGIITAAISDSGVFAVATKAEGYSSGVAVFNKRNEKIFEWFSSDETINNLALSSNGKNLAVSTVKVLDGKFLSTLYVLKFNSADAVYKKTYSDDVIYQILPVSASTYSVVLSNNIEFVNYRKENVKSHSSDYSISLIKKSEGKIVAVRTVAANQDESIIEVYTLNGKLKSSFKVNSCVTDISYKGNKIYLLGSHNIFKYSTKGELLVETKSNFDVLFLEAISNNNVACIRNSSIDKCELTQTEE